MAPNPISTLKKGLSKFSLKIKARKDKLMDMLAKNEKLSDDDEHWLDHEANTVDEQRVLDILEAASDYEKEVGGLDANSKGIVKKLQEWAGDTSKVAGQKRQRKDPLLLMMQKLKYFLGSEFEKETKAPTKKLQAVQPTPPLAPVLAKKENAMLAQRIEILDWHHSNGKNQSKTTRHFAPLYPNLQIKQPLISSWVKDEVKWRDQWSRANQQGEKASKRARQTEHPEVSEMMALWVTKAMADKILLTGEVLRQKWEVFAKMAGVLEEDKLKLSNGWLSRFKGRFGLKQLKRHGEAASVEQKTVEDERKRVREIIKEFLALGYTLRDVFNMDETGLFYGCVPLQVSQPNV